MRQNRIWILGAPDPEMELIENILRQCGEEIIYATDESGRRVHPGNAYRCPVPSVPEGATVYAVECIDKLPEGWIRIDHHRPGDPGCGRPPAEFLPASSIGQVLSQLARWGLVEGVPVSMYADDPEECIPGTEYPCPGEIRAIPQDKAPYVWAIHTPFGWRYIPTEIVLAAAADHCLAAAYRGECPGIDPTALMRWRAETRAAFQGRQVEDVLADVERAREALREAPTTEIGGGVVRDLRARVVPELPEAAAREGMAFLASVTDRDGRRRVVLGGRTSSKTVRAFMTEWAPARGLVDIYGDPARGFAGGYLQESTG